MTLPPDVIDAMQHAYDKADCGLTDAESPMHAALSVAQEYIATALRAAAGAREWLPLETALKDGTRVLWGGRWKGSGEWTEEIFHYGSLSSVMPERDQFKNWYSAGFYTPDHWNVEWTHWQPLPEPPATDQQREG